MARRWSMGQLGALALASGLLGLGHAQAADGTPQCAARRINPRELIPKASQLRTLPPEPDVAPYEAAGVGGSGEPERPRGAFTLLGTLAGKSATGWTIDRAGLPAAKLQVRADTRLTLDGREVTPRALPVGAAVEATFQLDGASPVALTIDARSLANR